MKKSYILLSFLIILQTLAYSQEDLSSYVNPLIGTGAHGHTYPGATVPFGMVQLSPDTRLEGWDGCGGYHYTDKYIYGFSHTHLSGTGVPDYCDVLIAPYNGEIVWNNGADGKRGYGSQFSHDNEVAKAGHYKVLLSDYDINVELTATKRVGMHKYTFNNNSEKNILIDLFHRDEVLSSSLKVIDNKTIEGKRISRYWAKEQHVYFVIKFSVPFTEIVFSDDNKTIENITEIGDSKNLKACLRFDESVGNQILVKVGLSAVSTQGAMNNLNAELPHWDFEKVVADAKNMWNKELSKIVVEGGTHDQKVVFYTALYHTMVCPNIYIDVDGKYRGMDLKVHNDIDFDNYTVFSLWDTYRAWHPLMTIIDQKRTLDYIKTFLNHYDKGGLLPVWELSANETFCMIGYHSVPAIVDAYFKGINDFDTKKALEAMQTSAFRKGNKGLKALHEKGLIEIEDEAEGVSKTLEYCFDDWCIAMFAKSLGDNDVYKNFIQRSQNYKNVFDTQTGFMRGKTNGGWVSPFSPCEVNANYTEANSWQYSFAPVHDISGLIDLHGGKAQLAEKLDMLFAADEKTTGREQVDITGLIGQYAQGNEPSHHIAYLHNYVSEPWKTQYRVNEIMTTMYTNSPEGLIGNEDCGQMSAWFVFSAMGFYPVTPGADYYAIGTPLFDKVTINLENGKKFVISASRDNANDFYVQDVKINNKKHKASYIKHNTIMKGGEMRFTLANEPNKNWGVGKKNEPVTSVTDEIILPVPALKSSPKSYKDSLVLNFVEIPDVDIYYSIERNDKVEYPVKYQNQIVIKDDYAKLHFYAKKGNLTSKTITSEYYKLNDDRDITLLIEPAKHYSSGGSLNLMDNIRCVPDFRVVGWLGFQEDDFEAVVEFKQPKTFNTVATGFLSDENAWIFLPTKVEYYVSDDGVNYQLLGEVPNEFKIVDEAKTYDFALTYKKSTTARYVKVVAKAVGKCPSWHKGAGGKCWLFTDEIIFK